MESISINDNTILPHLVMQPLTTSFAIVIPVFNEEKRLPRLFETLRQFSFDEMFATCEIIFVNDGSTDQTLALLHVFSAGQRSIRIISYIQNQGKGHAVRQGMMASSADYTLLLDVDLSTPLSEIKKLVPEICVERDVLIGTRKIAAAQITRHQPWLRENLGKGFTWIARQVTGVEVSDFTCGFKCFSRRAREAIFSCARVDRWSYDAELLFLAKRYGFEITEVPVNWHNDDSTRVRLSRDIIDSFFDLVKIRWYHRTKSLK